jgi:rare lipoprotein A
MQRWRVILYLGLMTVQYPVIAAASTAEADQTLWQRMASALSAGEASQAPTTRHEHREHARSHRSREWEPRTAAHAHDNNPVTEGTPAAAIAKATGSVPAGTAVAVPLSAPVPIKPPIAAASTVMATQAIELPDLAVAEEEVLLSLGPRRVTTVTVLPPPLKTSSRAAERRGKAGTTISTCDTGERIITAFYWESRHTASGEPFNPHGMTAAHRTLPFGTQLTVTNPRNGQSVVVTVNDRGPFVSGVNLDLSLGAAKAIGMQGTGSVCIEPSEVASASYRTSARP